LTEEIRHFTAFCASGIFFRVLRILFYGFYFVKSLEFFRMSSLNREIEVNSTTEQNNLQAEEQSG